MAEIDDELRAMAQARVGHTLRDGKYRLDRVLGIGGMATVYAGVHRNGHRVAVKLLHPEFSVRADIRKRFLREGMAANAVNHPGAVAVIDDDVAEDGAAFLVMERLEGDSLERIWEKNGRRLPVDLVLGVARDLCATLVAAHAAGIVHRDLKPENLFLTTDGRLKVLDFGLAQLRDAARPKDTHTGMVFGTPAFMPPEQASGQISKIDARTDLWAVGATIFTLLSGALVHEGETAQHFVMLSATAPARSLATVWPDAHPELIALVDRALTMDKELRWQSASEMRDAVRRASKLLLGDPDGPLAAPPAFDPDDTTRQKVARIGEALETLDEDERTKIDRSEITERKPAPEVASSSPPTQPKMRVPAAIESEVEDETRTNVRNAPDDLETEVSTRPRRLQMPRPIELPKLADPDDFQDRTQLLAHQRPFDRPSVAAQIPNKQSTPRIRAPMPSAPGFSDRQILPAFVARHHAPRATTRTKAKPKPRLPLLPVIVASVVLALSPIAWFVVRDCGHRTAPSAPAPVIPVASVAPNVPLRTEAPIIEAAPELPLATEPTVDAQAPKPQAPLAAPHIPLPPRALVNCNPPFSVDRDGIRHPKPECLAPNPYGNIPADRN